jgi:intergrase/recombinase
VRGASVTESVINILDEKRIIDKLNETERDYKWFLKKKEELRKKYANKFIAILNRRVIASSANAEQLIKKLKKRKLQDAIIEFIEPMNVVVIY